MFITNIYSFWRSPSLGRKYEISTLLFTVSEYRILLTRESTCDRHRMNKQSIWKLQSSLLLHAIAAQWNRLTHFLWRLFHISFKWNFITLPHQKFEIGPFHCTINQSRPSYLFWMGRRGVQRRLEMYFAIQIKCSLMSPDFNQLKKFYDLLKNYPASSFAKFVSDVPALLNVFRRTGRAKLPKGKIRKWQ